MNPKAKYWVASDGDQPQALFFSWEAAEANNSQYIDCFDAEGAHLEAHKRTDAGYTSDF